MRTKTWTNGLKLFIALSMIPATVVIPRTSYANPPAGEQCEPKKLCDAEVAKQRANDIRIRGLTPSGTTRAGAEQLSSESASAKAVSCEAQTVCETQAAKCKETDPKCKGKCEEIKKNAGQMATACVAAGTGTTGGMETAKAASASGGDSSGMMGALLGAGLGAAAMMMMQKDNQQEQQQQQMPYNGALQANGTIDCSKPDALVYRDCNANMEARCASILDDPTCQQFSSRYCGPTVTGTTQIVAQPQTPPNVAFGVDPSTLYGAVGEGVASQYCRGVSGWNYCKTSGRQSCPSCLQIQRNQSAACAQNPALCLAQNSAGEMESARTSCPTDPAFADPNYASSAAVNAQNGGSLPAVVLPQSVAAGNNGGSGSNSGGGISTQSVGGGTREGAASNINSQAAYGGAGSAYAPASTGVGGREFASAGGYKAAGPASDVEGQYGPSLFTTSSQVIRRRCAAGRLNNCP